MSSRPEKKWDAPTLAIAASYNSLALAAGDEGLFELAIGNGWLADRRTPVQLATRNCVDCSWTFHSIFCSSHVNSGFLASFRKETEYQDHSGFKRIFEGLVPAEEIFQHQGYTWGTQDKLCQVQGHIVSITRYTPWAEQNNERLKNLGSVDLALDIELAPWKGGVVSGGLAVFGAIIECENAVVVVPSEGRAITISGEPVNWRVFPRSVQYENQLHLIFNDRLEVFSFNQDYFVDQRRKLLGIQAFAKPSYGVVRTQRRPATN